MNVLITGANGFLGRNLQQRLRERLDVNVTCFSRGQQSEHLTRFLDGVDMVFHLAGVNRPQELKEFTVGNTDFTRELCGVVAATARSTGKPISILYASSTQADLDNAYGRSKREAEVILAKTG